MHRVDSVKIVMLSWYDMRTTQTVHCTSVLYLYCFGIISTDVVNKLKKLCTVFVLLMLLSTSDHTIVFLWQTAVVTLERGHLQYLGIEGGEYENES